MTTSGTKENRNILKAYNMMIYFAGTMIMWDPSNECISDFWNQGIVRSLPVRSSNPNFLIAASHLRNSTGQPESNFVLMKEDFVRLFTGAGSAAAPPYESVYTEAERIISGQKTLEVREFYRSYGWESKFRNEIPDDHLGIELLFLTLMVEKLMDLDDAACRTEMKSEIRRFISSHLMNWVPRWNADLQENALTMSYKGIGSLIVACVEDLDSIMSA